MMISTTESGISGISTIGIPHLYMVLKMQKITGVNAAAANSYHASKFPPLLSMRMMTHFLQMVVIQSKNHQIINTSTWKCQASVDMSALCNSTKTRVTGRKDERLHSCSKTKAFSVFCRTSTLKHVRLLALFP